MSIQLCLISWMNFDYKENVEMRNFSYKFKASISVLQYGECDYSANNNMNADYYEYPSLSHFTNEPWLWGKWWKKNFCGKSKLSISCILMKEHDCSAHNKKNGDYYEIPSLSHFTSECYVQGKWWKEKLFLQILSFNIVYPNEKNIIVVPITKEWILLWLSKFISFHWWTLFTTRKVERKAFLANPKHQCRAS